MLSPALRGGGSWQYSTFHRLVVRGIYAPDWVGVHESEMEAGERV